MVKYTRYKYFRWVLLTSALLGIFLACTQQYSPKPRGYFRISFPEKEYQSYQGACSFTFDLPVYSRIETNQENPCWMDIVYPEFNARLHLSYLPIHSRGDLLEMVEDAHELAFKHTVKATAILQTKIAGEDDDVNGLLYEIKGNTASNLQFFLTDSVQHYLRGALYFNEKPRIDSIQPVLDFIREDVEVLVRTLHWK